jgi:predicted DNA-binding transcriptional regulator YafY
MRRAERLFRLVNELRARRIARADDLAATFEVSVRTVYRDIAHLQGSGLPIEGEAGVGYVLRPGYDLPNMTFTFEQVEALAVGLSFAESLDDPALATAAREVRAKLQATMPQPETRRLADAPFFALRRSTGAASLAGPLRQAIRKKRVIMMDYADGEGRATTRRVRPLAIWNLAEGWMFSGWCEMRCGFRTFRLDRIVGMTLTDDVFADDPAKGLQAFLDSERCEAAPAQPGIAVQ